ncbi:MAG: HEAT repeat domain-containing protein [Gemmatimonadaceae bacterium]
MNPALAFALQFGRLLTQRVREPNNVEAHRASLAELAAANAEPVTLVWDNWQLRAGRDVLAATEPGMLDLLSRMAAHGVRELSFSAKTDRAHLLGVVWILTQDPKIGDGGANATSRLRMLGTTSVGLVPVTGIPTVSLTPSSQPAVTEASRAPSISVESGPATPLALEAVNHDTSDMLLARLAGATTPEQITRVLGGLATFTDTPETCIEDIVRILLALIEHEERSTDSDVKREMRHGMKRVARPTTFRALAAILSTGPADRDRYIRIFEYFGDDAADEVIEQLAHAESATERRVLFDALVELKRGVPTLIYLLGDGRWYVVRNAAELLGEMRAAEAEQGLAWLLTHTDPRVRQSATSALAKLETPGARAALRNAIRDESRDVRMNATLALAGIKERGSVAVIVRALADEYDPDVQKTLMAALVRIGTPEAVQRLVEVAEPASGLFKKKSTPLRVAALEALAESQAPDAIAAVQALTRDREREVRDAATRALRPRKSTPTATPETARVGW